MNVSLNSAAKAAIKRYEGSHNQLDLARDLMTDKLAMGSKAAETAIDQINVLMLDMKMKTYTL